MVWKYKVGMPGVPARYKCRLTAKGFMELFGMPYKTVAEVRREVGHPELKDSIKPVKS